MPRPIPRERNGTERADNCQKMKKISFPLAKLCAWNYFCTNGVETTMNDHDGCIILNLLNGIGGLSAWKRRGSPVDALIGACGSVSAVFDSDADTLSRIDGIGAALVGRIASWRKFVDLDREQETAKKEGVTILCRTDDDYPASLRELTHPPLCVYLLGSLPAGLAIRSVAIVGTRTPSDFGVRMAREFSMSAARAGWSTVSGLASGIDTVAHRSTVEAGGMTVAVLGSGLANVYPPENIELARDIVRAGGAIVSEYPMNTGSTRYTLPRRNRIIAGLSRCTLVVEAAERSGALMTAAHAANRGCPVFAMPGAEDDPLASGCNDLIRQGTKPARSFDDILGSI